MLEFQEGFFEQEIRNGFYIDVTMKTVWAAELELLQKVAEVCDKYGLTWYAAYGSLLGAIRHEGFVPWDDDMDIWMKRKDYNKLMQVLQKELPEGYMVRGPLTELGYDQFHTCVNTGCGVNISKEWLEQFHGCPFTVGLDIFPLDYLPREEKDRELQKNLYVMASAAAQIARGLDRGEFDAVSGEEEEVVQTRIADLKAKIEGQIDYLQENCKLPINRKLYEEERWSELASEMWKWANHIAMMYEEHESDDLVMYMDYCKWNYKKFPKEWFEEVYSATFENFMLPIPAGYDRTLSAIYGNYHACVKKTGMHEYPYYARQLREVRAYVKQKELESLAQTDGATEIVMPQEAVSLPGEWEELMKKPDGSRKKVVLSANDPWIYAAYGDSGLDHMEETLKLFAEHRQELVLWWRPQPMMRKVLEQVDVRLGERYQQILDDYKAAGWGICDESEQTELAVEYCDAYYGDMNAIIQPFQNEGKTIMISKLHGWEDAMQINRERYVENNLFLSTLSFLADGEKVYFSNHNYNALVELDKKSLQINRLIPFSEKKYRDKEIHAQVLKLGEKLYFIPKGNHPLHVYDLKSCEQQVYSLPTDSSAELNRPWYAQAKDEKLYLFPCYSKQGLWSMAIDSGELMQEKWWNIGCGGKYMVHGSMGAQKCFSLEIRTNRLYITDLERSSLEEYSLPDEQIYRVQYDGRDFWYITCNSCDVVRWNPEQGEVQRYEFPLWKYCHNTGIPYYGFWVGEKDIYLVSGDSSGIYKLNRSSGGMNIVVNLQESLGATLGTEPCFQCIQNELIVTLGKVQGAVCIHIDTDEVQIYKNIGQEDMVKAYQDKVVFQLGALFLEESEDWTVDKYIQFCQNIL